MTDYYGWRIDVIDTYYVICIGKHYIAKTDHYNNYPGLTTKDSEIKIYEKVEDALKHLVFILESQYIGWIHRCPDCARIVQTTCSACGCGSCLICGHRFKCGMNVTVEIELIPSINYNEVISSIYSTERKDIITEGIS